MLHDDANPQRAPHVPIDLDPSLRDLLHDAGDSLKHLKQRHHSHPKPPTELHVYDNMEEPILNLEPAHTEADGLSGFEHREERRSPAAVLGSDRPGMIMLSEELVDAITGMVSETDKYQLRSDAKRLFLHPSPASVHDLRWSSKTPQHSSKKKEKMMGPRDGLAFATVAMPAHYTAIATVFEEAKQRLGRDWEIDSIVDFGAKAGAVLWAARDTFKSIDHYMGFDNRSGMVSMAQALITAANVPRTNIKFENFWGPVRELSTAPEKTAAVCAFSLSDLKTDLDRQKMLREMWSTGAEYMIVIDHGTKEGFQYVADAREFLLRKGRQETKHADEPVDAEAEQHAETSQQGSTPSPVASADASKRLGSHVVAPCPHDGRCPLHDPFTDRPRRKDDVKQARKKAKKLEKDATQLMGPTSFCHFTQRLQRPEFVRLTKHAYKATEDVTYSYVVIRRGTRPEVTDMAYMEVAGGAERMRRGAVARDEALSVERKERKQEGGSAVVEEDETGALHLPGKAPADDDSGTATQSEAEVAADMASLRLESYGWPRVIYPPIKRSGHVILDACTVDGNISRITIPRSQGKQAYHDARKSSWGDIFPHPPKNGLEVRRRGRTPTKAGEKGAAEEEDEEDDFDFEKYIGTYTFGDVSQ
ncbi:37S ribosomal protein S22 [Tulasnella sp. JGI-2019a]|nr:37S ribosomal protein S22 [Tulasnella sp. JGI-2019a]